MKTKQKRKGRKGVTVKPKDVRLLKKYIKNRDENRSILAMLTRFYTNAKIYNTVKAIENGDQD